MTIMANSTITGNPSHLHAVTSGLLIIDKPQGVTSHDMVAAVRGALHMKRVGHAGTLDPMATGVLIIGFGNATRLLNVIVDHDKTYEATIRLGQRTTTDDADGDVVPGDNAVTDIAYEDIVAMIDDRFTGDIEQVPNAYSAIKINGRRAYDLARDGKQVDLKARPVTVSEFTVLGVRRGATCATTPGMPLQEYDDDSSIPVIDVDVRVSCSAGTYIRALARDLGDALGVGGHLIRLRRTRIGGYRVDGQHVVTAHTESRTFTTRNGETMTRNRAVLDCSPEQLIDASLSMVVAARSAMPSAAIDGEQARDLRFGRRVTLAPDAIIDAGAQLDTSHDGTEGNHHMALSTSHRRIAVYVSGTDDLVAIVEPCGHGMAKPVTVFPQ